MSTVGRPAVPPGFSELVEDGSDVTGTCVKQTTVTGETYLLNVATGEKVIPGSLRPDGTMRKSIKVRAGYTPAVSASRVVVADVCCRRCFWCCCGEEVVGRSSRFLSDLINIYIYIYNTTPLLLLLSAIKIRRRNVRLSERANSCQGSSATRAPFLASQG